MNQIEPEEDIIFLTFAMQIIQAMAKIRGLELAKSSWIRRVV